MPNLRMSRPVVIFLFVGLAVCLPAVAQTTDYASNPIVKFVWMAVQTIVYGMGGVFAVWGLLAAVKGQLSDDMHQRNDGLKKILWGLVVFGAMPLVRWIYNWWVANAGEGVTLEEIYIPGVTP